MRKIKRGVITAQLYKNRVTHSALGSEFRRLENKTEVVKQKSPISKSQLRQQAQKKRTAEKELAQKNRLAGMGKKISRALKVSSAKRKQES